MTSPQEFEAIIVGGGQGAALARYLARGGMKTALIESGPIGGTCVNYGCTPSKTLIASARTAYVARRAKEFGIQTGVVSADWPKVRRRALRIVKNFRDEIGERLESTPGLTWLHGTASFVSPDILAVAPSIRGKTPQLVHAPRIVLATGTGSAVPDIEGMDDIDWLDSESILQLRELPRHLIIIGGGYIGLEYGQMMRRLGAQVTIVQASTQVLSREDTDIAEALQDILREDGIRLFLSTKATRFQPTKNGIRVTLETPSGPKNISGSHVLFATGRRPNIESLALVNGGIHTDEKGYITVNGALRTSRNGVWAMGDVAGSPPFTHVAFDDARQLRDHFLHGAKVSTRDRLYSYVVFTDPQLGRTGLSEREAREKGHCIHVAHLPVCDTARGIESGETRGFLKAIIDAKTDRILGGSFLAPEGGELIAVLQTAILGKLPYTALRDAPIAHPTLAESLNRLFIGLEDTSKIGKEC
jgi:pyruvate/2-oxoglutarate dehydrogenase complex dihydrolipoamide dehydrogenase (E3) component